MKIVLSLMSFILIGCTTAPKFGLSSDGSSGYHVIDKQKNVLEVRLQLPSDTSDKDLLYYGQRAVAEECLKRGFDYSNFSEDSKIQYTGYCYPTNEYKALAITFEKDGLATTPSKFIIESLNNKSSTLLQIKDEVLTIAGNKITSMTQVKNIIFEESKKSNSVPITLIRNGKNINIIEPLAQFKSALAGPEDLKILRKYTN